MNDETTKARWNLPAPYESCSGDAEPEARSRRSKRSPQTEHFSRLCMREKQQREHNSQKRSGSAENDRARETNFFDQEPCDSPGTESTIAARTKCMAGLGIYVFVILPTMSADGANKTDRVPQGRFIRMKNGAPAKLAHFTALAAATGACVA